MDAVVDRRDAAGSTVVHFQGGVLWRNEQK